jgi:poly-gamma-glutamate capsule biosynthesis protein CapA/YwtB (metallophosphatase superfamily)
MKRAQTPLALAVAAIVLVSARPASAQPARSTPDPETFQYRDLTRELANKMTGTYIIAATGDLLIQEPIGKMIDPKIQQILRDADTTIGNMEATIVDRRNPPMGFRGNWSPKETAKDVAALGFDLLTGANNHTWDMGEEGLKSNIKYLDEAGIPLAGVGPNLSTARMPVFQQTAKGRVGLVGAYAVSVNGGGQAGIATDRHGILGGSWGVNPLRLTTWNVVTEMQLQQLKGIRDSIVARRGEVTFPIMMPKDQPNRVQIFAENYMSGPKPGEYHYDINRTDRQGNLIAIRTTKEYGDFAIFTMHVHQNRFAFQDFAQDHYPCQFLIDFTHELVDNGADMYVGHGNHTIQGVEIYKGRAIFYNLGNFAVHEILVDGENIPPGMTAVENDELSTDRLQTPDNMSALVAVTRYENGKLAEVRLYPIDLGVGKNRPWSHMSIAQTPSPALAADILKKVQEYSAPFGTKISIENGVGVIRVPPEATVPIGAGIRETFKRRERERE